MLNGSCRTFLRWGQTALPGICKPISCFPSSSIGEDCASHTVPTFPTSTRGNVTPSFSLPRTAAAPGHHCIPHTMACTECTQLTAEPPGMVHALHSWSKHRESSCKPPTLGEPSVMGRSRVPVPCLLNTELFLHIKNDHSVCVWGAQGVYNRPGLALF